MATLVQTPRVRDCLPALLLFDHNCDELSLPLRRGAAAVLAFELTSGNRPANKFFILREYFLLQYISLRSEYMRSRKPMTERLK
jgi:hypothetical protein